MKVDLGVRGGVDDSDDSFEELVRLGEEVQGVFPLSLILLISGGMAVGSY